MEFNALQKALLTLPNVFKDKALLFDQNTYRIISLSKNQIILHLFSFPPQTYHSMGKTLLYISLSFLTCCFWHSIFYSRKNIVGTILVFFFSLVVVGLGIIFGVKSQTIKMKSKTSTSERLQKLTLINRFFFSSFSLFSPLHTLYNESVQIFFTNPNKKSLKNLEPLTEAITLFSPFCYPNVLLTLDSYHFLNLVIQLMKNKKLQTQEYLWCLPYDTDSVFKPFLKMPFSYYLNNIISNEYFPAYQASMALEVKQKSAWNQKSWRLIQFFEYLNETFDTKKWDNSINFIQDNHLRCIMGFFRLWIDTQRLYLLNFLKLDSNEFQEDRIFMSLYRTLIVFNSVFTQYMFNDFQYTFLNDFIRNSIAQLTHLSLISTNDTAQLINAIISLLKNIKKKEKILIQFGTLQALKKSALIKVSKEGEVIKQVQNRLKNSDLYRKKLNEEFRLKMICKDVSLDDFIKPLQNIYDPISKIQQLTQELFYGSTQEKQKIRRETIAQRIQAYKKQVKSPKKIELNAYQELEKNDQNPYSLKNYQVYGEAVKVNMQEKLKYEKVKEAEVVSMDDHDRSKFYYEDQFFRDIENSAAISGKVTAKDVNMSTRSKKQMEFKNQNQEQNTRVFNLKWHQDGKSSKRTRDNIDYQNDYSKDYDNNLLFKSPLEEQMLQNRKNNLDKLKEIYETKSYTVALLEQTADQIHPEYNVSSQGANLFVKKSPQILDLVNFRFLNQNKFDFMRKVVGYTTAQKKIKELIASKNVPEKYPRYFSDVSQQSYNPELQTNKVQFALGRSNRKPQLYL